MKTSKYSKKYIKADGTVKIYTYNKIYNQKYICECSGKYTQYNKNHHSKSKKHQKYLKSLENVEINLV